MRCTCNTLDEMYKVHVVSDCYIQHLKMSLYPKRMLRQSLRVSKRPQRTAPRALIYTMFISTDYTPVTCFIFYSPARSLQPLVPFKGLFRWRLQSRITSLWQLANIRQGSAQYEAMWQHKLTLLLQFTDGIRWMCASLWQFFARSVVGVQEPEQNHYTCDIWRSEDGD